ncbi:MULTISPECIES: penicillin acylase family protein [Bacteria]|uniref:penicillin acylase family protein n=1 Tax=Bacteria TaxID=2 RepID=UPI003C7DFA33
MAEVFRDALGIPHIRATDVRDLARAQGEVTARDRAWQIEVDRLRAAGRLSELIGEAGLAWDVFARRARLDDTARRAYSRLDEASGRFVADYAAGVRIGLRDSASAVAEFRVLDERFGDTRPLTPWEDHDPLGVLHVAHALFSTFPSVLWREHVAATLGDPWVDVFAGDDGNDETLPTAGSNAWALHGTRTASGLPLLAGDPHRLLELPGVYQQIRLACDEFDVVGLAFPGVPGVPHFGHTGSAAWGVTNAVAHSVDVFEERLRTRGDGYEARGPDGWEPVDVHRSVVHMRGGGPGPTVEALETARGCVVTELRPDGDELRGWSIRQPARTNTDLGGDALLPLLRARTATEVIEAFSSWVDPVNRVLAADREGTVLSATVGRLPERPRAGRRRALRAETVGPVPDRRLAPARVVSDVAVDANQRPSRPEVDYGWAYPSSHRAERIAQLLDTVRPGRSTGFTEIWGDTVSGARTSLLALLPTGDLPAPAAEARAALLRWDGRMDAASRGAGVFAAWRTALVQAVVAHPLVAPLRAPHGFGAIFEPWMSVEGQVAMALPRLLGHPALRPDVSGMLVSSLSQAATAPVWGSTHRMLPLHVLADLPGVTPPGAGMTTPLDGDGDAVRCTGSVPGLTDRSIRGSVARWAWDLADREQSLWNVPFGASGDPRSPHFADQHPRWIDVRPARVVTDWSALTPDEPAGSPTAPHAPARTGER